MGPPIFDSSEPKLIVNVKCDTQVADLILANPNGPVAGFKQNASKEQQWYIEPRASNTYAFRSATSPNVYANTFTHLSGVPVLGYVQSTNFKIVIVDPVKGIYRIQTNDDTLLWVLENCQNYYVILLRPVQQWQNKSEAHWRFTPVPPGPYPPPDQPTNIISVACPGQVADLLGAVPTAPIAGYHCKVGAKNQEWYFLLDGSIKNAATSTYASVCCEFQGAELFGCTQATHWVWEKVKDDIYYIKTKDGKYYWALQCCEDYTQITILPSDIKCINKEQIEWRLVAAK